MMSGTKVSKNKHRIFLALIIVPVVWLLLMFGHSMLAVEWHEGAHFALCNMYNGTTIKYDVNWNSGEVVCANYSSKTNALLEEYARQETLFYHDTIKIRAIWYMLLFLVIVFLTGKYID